MMSSKQLRSRTVPAPPTQLVVPRKSSKKPPPPSVTAPLPINKKDALLQQLYLDPLEATAFGSAKHLLEAAKKRDPDITKQDVRKFLHGITAYTRLYPPTYKFKRRPIIAFTRGYHQIDLAAMLGIRRHNKSYSYILVAVDTLSGMMYAEPIKKKTAAQTADAYRMILSRCDYKVRFAQTDEGREFGGAFRDLLKSRGIRLFNTKNKTTKAAGAERAIRTLKRRLYLYMLKRKVFKWYDTLQKIVTAINNSKSSVTKMKPSEITTKNEEVAFVRRYHSGKHPLQTKYSFKRGDMVRFLQDPGSFRRSFYPVFSPIVYEVVQRYPTRPHIYQIKDPEDDRPLFRRFYSKELVKSETMEVDYTSPPKHRLPPL